MGASALIKMMIVPLIAILISFIIYVSFQWDKNSCIAESYEINLKKNKEMVSNLDKYNSINYPKVQEKINDANHEFRREYEDYISKNAGVVRSIYADKLHILSSEDVHNDKHSSTNNNPNGS